MPKCVALTMLPASDGSGQKCTQDASETVDGHGLCWVHARREERIAVLGFTPAETKVRLQRRRFADEN